MYRSDRIQVHGPSATGQYRRNRSSAVNFDHQWSIKGERRRGRRRKRRKERDTYSSPNPRASYHPRAILGRRASFSARGEGARKEKGTPRGGTRRCLISPRREKENEGTIPYRDKLDTPLWTDTANLALK
ncbi:hypothetical protein BHM03_00025684 [Ensete ventricosum]|nr:hypothetical protein BHM03_00025684 [Ensete ventricosum]